MPDLSRRRSSRQKGDRGEALALSYLAKKGYKTLERNYRTRHGEIDLVMRSERVLVFVEVKLRRGLGFGDPLEAVTPRKQAAIRALAERYLSDNEPDFEAVRFDVVGILLGDRTPRIVHLEDAF